MIDDDIYNRIIEFKAENKIIKMNRNYGNNDKKYGKLNTFMCSMLTTNVSPDMRMWRPFHNKFGVIVSWGIVCTNDYAQM